MTTITLIKTLPTSVAYTGSGVITISLIGVQQLAIDSKNDRVFYPINKTNYLTDPIDSPVKQAIDIQNCTESMKFTGWLEDDANDTAWNKLWKLRAMATVGGPLYTLTIGTASPMVFPTPNPLIQANLNTYDEPQQPFIPYAYLEHVMAQIESDDTGDITASHSAKPARIKVDLDIALATIPLG